MKNRQSFWLYYPPQLLLQPFLFLHMPKMLAGHRKTETGTTMTPMGSPLQTPGKNPAMTGTIWIPTESEPHPPRLTNTM